MSEENLPPGGLPSLSSVAPKFLVYAEAELQFARRSLDKYRDCLRQVGRMLGDRPVDQYSADDILLLKSRMLQKQHSVSRQVSILSALSNVCWRIAGGAMAGPVLDPEAIVVPKRPRREVVYLTPEEVARFVSVIPLYTQRGKPSLDGLRFARWLKPCWAAPCASASCYRSSGPKSIFRRERPKSSGREIRRGSCSFPSGPFPG